MSRIQCFFLEPTNQAEVTLRRYRNSRQCLRDENGKCVTKKSPDGKFDVCIDDTNYDGKCPGMYGYCNADVLIGLCEYTKRSVKVTDEMKLEPEWPKKCDFCDRDFSDDDHWQWNETQLYERADSGELVTLRAAPVGAMWNAPWYKDFSDYKKRPDDLLLVVKTPGGDWCVDGPSSNGNGWERTGAVPNVTATPSILMPRYHGWLRNGFLEEC